jgi:hypothetical protein
MCQLASGAVKRFFVRFVLLYLPNGVANKGAHIMGWQQPGHQGNALE